MPSIATPRLNGIIGKGFDTDQQYRVLLKECRRWTKYSNIDMKAKTIKLGTGFMSKSYPIAEFEKKLGTMERMFAAAEHGTRITWRNRLLGLATDDDLKAIFNTLMVLRHKIWKESAMDVFGLDVRKRDRTDHADRALADPPGEKVEMVATEEFLTIMIQNKYKAMGNVFGTMDTETETYNKTCDKIEQLLAGQNHKSTDMWPGVVREDIDEATMDELREVIANFTSAAYPEGSEMVTARTATGTARGGRGQWTSEKVELWIAWATPVLSCALSSFLLFLPFLRILGVRVCALNIKSVV